MSDIDEESRRYEEEEGPAGPGSGPPPPPTDAAAAPGPGAPEPASDPGQGRRRGPGPGGPPDLGPQFNFPGLPGFQAPQFAVPTFEQAMAEPGYAFRSQAGQDALERSAAARGVLRTGGTLKDILEYGQKFGAQEYSNVYNRALQSFDRKYQGARDTYAPQLAQWQTRANAEIQRALALYSNQNRNRGGGGGGGGGLPPMDVILGAPPVPPEYAQAFGQPGFGVMPPIEY